MKDRADIAGLQLAIRVALAALPAFALAEALRLPHPIYAFIAAVIVTDLSPRQSRRLGATRIASTVVGAATGAALSQWLPAGLLALGIGVLASMLACQLLKVSEGAKVAGYICGLILIDHSGEPWSYALWRFAETVLGIAVAWSVSAIPHLIAPADREGE